MPPLACPAAQNAIGDRDLVLTRKHLGLAAGVRGEGRDDGFDKSNFDNGRILWFTTAIGEKLSSLLSWDTRYRATGRRGGGSGGGDGGGGGGDGGDGPRAVERLRSSDGRRRVKDGEEEQCYYGVRRNAAIERAERREHTGWVYLCCVTVCNG